MTIFEELSELSEKLDDRARASLIQSLARLYDIYDEPKEAFELCPEQEAEITRRLINPHVKYASEEEIEALFAPISAP
jgi:hypothetical protein